METNNVNENIVVDNTTSEENSLVTNTTEESTEVANEVANEETTETTENLDPVENNQVMAAPLTTSGETVEDISPDVTTINTLIIEEKLDNIIALEAQQMSTSLICMGLLVAGIVIYLLYKFITNFFEF